MIPPVEEREIRTCYNNDHLTCVFYSCDDCYAYCQIGMAKHSGTDYYELERPEKCGYHFTRDEIRELIDSGAIP